MTHNRCDWRPTHIHRKGSYYEELARCTGEDGQTVMVAYRDGECRVWLRPAAEFDDGRFERVAATRWPYASGTGGTTIAAIREADLAPMIIEEVPPGRLVCRDAVRGQDAIASVHDTAQSQP